MYDIPLIEFDGSLRKLFIDLLKLSGAKVGRQPPEDHPYWESQECHGEIDRMMTAQQARAPAGYYFGASIWDPMAIGFWRENDT